MLAVRSLVHVTTHCCGWSALSRDSCQHTDCSPIHSLPVYLHQLVRYKVAVHFNAWIVLAEPSLIGDWSVTLTSNYTSIEIVLPQNISPSLELLHIHGFKFEFFFGFALRMSRRATCHSQPNLYQPFSSDSIGAWEVHPVSLDPNTWMNRVLGPIGTIYHGNPRQRCRMVLTGKTLSESLQPMASNDFV